MIPVDQRIKSPPGVPNRFRREKSDKKALQRLEVMKTISENLELAQLGRSLGIPIITLNND
jgi:hypothetical protein